MMQHQRPQQQDTDTDEYQLDLTSFDLADFVNNDVFAPQQPQQIDSSQPGGGQQQQQQHSGDQSAQMSPMGSMTPPNEGGQQMYRQSEQPEQQQPAQPQMQAQQMPLMPAATLKESFQMQQMRFQQIQQLQQLQSHIIQQQMELLNGSTPQPMTMQGLLTPAPSTELRAAVNGDYVSPMMLQGGMYVPDPSGASQSLYNSLVSPAMSPHMPNPSFSAPAAFQPAAIPSGSDNFSPLTSPALGPVNYSHAGLHSFQQQLPHQLPISMPMPLALPMNSATAGDFVAALSALSAQQAQQIGNYNLPHHSPYMQPVTSAPPSTIIRPGAGPSRSKRPQSTDLRQPLSSPSRKRPASPSDGNTRPSRTRSSTNVRLSKRASMDDTAAAAASFHGTMSAPTYPVMSEATDTPSPVDISIPPATPFPEPSSAASHSHAMMPPPNITPTAPVTPASLMNLPATARQPSGLAVNTDVSASTRGSKSRSATSSKKAGLPLSTNSSRASTGSKPSPAIRPVISPSLKPILPGSHGLSAEAVQHLSLKSNYQNILEGRASDLGISMGSDANGGMEVRKTSHKAAEQKRRDSLKAGFDDLRLLLPPITIDPDAEGAEHLPGSAPPRGPARNVPPGTEDHPNRGVSKLALLRHSNEFIVKLGKRIQRRDKAVKDLRDEVERLREKLGEEKLLWEDLDEEENEEEERKAKGKEKDIEMRPRTAGTTCGSDDAMDGGD